MSGMPDEKWHLSRSVPISLLVGLLVQAAAFIWYASKLDSRVEDLEARQTVFEQRLVEDRQFHIDQRVRLWDRVQAIENAATQSEQRLARVEATTEHIRNQVDRLVDNLIRNARKTE